MLRHGPFRNRLTKRFSAVRSWVVEQTGPGLLDQSRGTPGAAPRRDVGGPVQLGLDVAAVTP